MIKYIREYKLFNVHVFDIIYSRDGVHASKIVSVTDERLPKTAQAFIKNAVKTELRKTKNESEYVYERREEK